MKRPNISKALKGHLVTSTRRKKISESLKKYFKTKAGRIAILNTCKLNSERVCTTATRQKRSKSMLGHQTTKGKHWSISDIGKKNMSNARKLRKRKLGYINSPETREKMRISQCKIKGGITPLKRVIQACCKYQQWRTDVFKRDNYTCQKCYAHNCYLEVHHLVAFSSILEKYNIKTIYDALKCEQLWNIGNGQTLCTKCHKLTENYGKNQQKVL